MNQIDTLVTPTGDRPLQFSVCLKLLARQTVLPKRWIVVDDGKGDETYKMVISSAPVPVLYIRLNPLPYMSLGRNMLEALPLMHGKCAIFEDDDYYPQEYLEHRAMDLDRADLVGLRSARPLGVPFGYTYNLSVPGYMVNIKHIQAAVWHSTCFNLEPVKATLETACKDMDSKKDCSVDLALWTGFEGTKAQYNASKPVHMVGWPSGRAGCTANHRKLHKFTQDSDDLSMLRKLCGNMSAVYAKVIKGELK